jgi:hypothetical protein
MNQPNRKQAMEKELNQMNKLTNPIQKPHDAVKFWNQKACPLCPGLGKKRRRNFLSLAFLTSDSYGFQPRDK